MRDTRWEGEHEGVGLAPPSLARLQIGHAITRERERQGQVLLHSPPWRAPGRPRETRRVGRGSARGLGLAPPSLARLRRRMRARARGVRLGSVFDCLQSFSIVIRFPIVFVGARARGLRLG